jgi:outer membrane protein insertion porin family
VHRRLLCIAAVLLCILLPQSAGAQGVIQSLRVEGAQRIDAQTVLNYVDIKPGDPFDPDLLDRALKTLFATGLFADISFFQEGDVLVVAIAENPIVNEIRFEGNKSFKSEDLETEIRVKPRTVFTRSRVEADVDRMREIYRQSGRFSATVDPKIIKLEQNRVNLVFEITEGPQTVISRVAFVGNNKFDDARLQSVISSKEDRWWKFLTGDNKFDPDRMSFDRELLRRFYLTHGYADFFVENAIAELSPDQRFFYMTFTVNEGERYKTGNVHIESEMPDVNTALLKPAVTLVPGEWYNADEVEKTVNNLTQELGNLQFAFVDIVPNVLRDKEKKVVNATFVIREGRKSFVDKINIKGNMRTLDEVIRREMTLVEGDPFNATKIKKSEQNIRNLNFFEKVDVKTVPGATPDKTNVDIEVAEKSTGSLSLGAGFSTTDGPLADFRIVERNFLGKGQQLDFTTTLSGRRSEFDLSFTEPYFLKRDLSAGVDLFHITRDLSDESSYDLRRTGGGMRLGYPLSEKWRQSIGYRVEKNKIYNVSATASNFIQQQEGIRTTSAISHRVNFDNLDSRIDPTEGVAFKMENELTGLGGDSKYFKTRVVTNYYHPIRDKWVASLTGEFGAVIGYGGEDVAINERFYLGGATLRGFADGGIGPRDQVTSDALGGNYFWRGSGELEMPSGLPEDLGVKLHAFTDFGSLFDVDDSGADIVDEASVRASLGLGVSWRSPAGPIRADFSIPVLKEGIDETESFRFNFGTRF